MGTFFLVVLLVVVVGIGAFGWGCAITLDRLRQERPADDFAQMAEQVIVDIGRVNAAAAREVAGIAAGRHRPPVAVDMPKQRQTDELPRLFRS